MPRSSAALARIALLVDRLGETPPAAWVGNLGSHAFATTAAPVAVKVGCMEVNESLTQLLLAHFEHNAPHAQTGADVTMGCEILAFANLHPIYDGNQMRCDYRAAST